MRYTWCSFFLGILISGSLLAVEQQAVQSLESISAVIQNAVVTELGQTETEFQMEPLQLDKRLRLPECTRPLESFILSGQKGSGYFSVGIRCTGLKPWTLYHKVRVNVYQTIVILKNAIRQGTPIGTSDLVLEKRSLTSLKGGYFTEPDTVIGQVARRSLPGGLVLNPDYLVIPNPVQRGQQVTIRVETAGFEIAMPGLALSDGRLGQRIRVRNVQSGKIVEGVVTGSGVISVN